MTLSLVSTSTKDGVFDGTTGTIPVPSGISVGDFIKITFEFQSRQSGNCTVSGFTDSGTIGGEQTKYVCYKVADSGDVSLSGSGSYTANFTDGFIWCAVCEVYTGSDGTTPLQDGPTIQGTFSSSVTASSVTASSATYYLISFCIDNNSGSLTADFTGPTLAVGQASSYSSCQARAYYESVSSGATGTRSATIQFGFEWGTVAFALNPASGGGGTTGSGSSTLSPFASSGAGNVAASGSGSSALSPFASSGAGNYDYTVSGSGASTLSPFASSGAGHESASGSGSSSMAPFASSGVGVVGGVTSGGGTSTLSPFASSGAGNYDFAVSGSGTSSLSAFACTGAGHETAVGSGSSSLATFASSGAGHVSSSGSGSSSMAPFACSGTGTYTGGGGAVNTAWPGTNSWPGSTCWPTTRSWP